MTGDSAMHLPGNDCPFGDAIFIYTRRQAIEDGVLVDLMQAETESLVREAGFTIPLAMTATAFATTVGPIGGELPPGQDLTGRLWDVLMLLKAAIRQLAARNHPLPADSDRVHSTVAVWNGRRHEDVNLWALIGPADRGEPVITIMLEAED